MSCLTEFQKSDPAKVVNKKFHHFINDNYHRGVKTYPYQPEITGRMADVTSAFKSG